MKWALLFALGGTGVVIVFACIVLLLLRLRLHRHHRVDPRVPTDAPVTWLVDPRSAPRLHRRLAKVGRTAALVGDDHRPPARRRRRSMAEEPPPIVVLADQLKAEAVAVDQQLARLVVLAPAARRQPVRDVERSVAELERTASRLVALSTDVRAPRSLGQDHSGLLDVAGQVDRLAEAHQALRDLDAEVGLVPRSQPAPPLTGVVRPAPPAVESSPPRPPT